jgi:(p)ppGpp synthase/HD superfamily hydrolase
MTQSGTTAAVWSGVALIHADRANIFFELFPNASEKLFAAYCFAAWHHRKQKRRGKGRPFIHHPLTVALIVDQAGGTEQQLMAAFLHDTIEDAEANKKTRQQVYARIRRSFGKDVADLVQALTNADKLDKKVKRQWQLAHYANAPATVRLVKSCDTVSKLVDEVFDPSRKPKSIVKVAQFLDAFLAQQPGTNPLAAQLRDEVVARLNLDLSATPDDGESDDA